MTIPESKKQYLKRAGMSDERIAEIEATLEEKSKMAAAMNLEFKAKNDDLITRKEVAEAIVETVAPLIEAVAKLNAVVKELGKEDEKRISSIPSTSLAAHIVKGLGINNRGRLK